MGNVITVESVAWRWCRTPVGVMGWVTEANLSKRARVVLRPVAVGAVLLAAFTIALAACSDREEPDAVEPSTEVLPEATSTVVATAASSSEVIETTATKEPFPSATSLSTPEKAAVREDVQPPPIMQVTPVPTQPAVTEGPPALPFMVENPRVYSRNQARVESGRFRIRAATVIYRLKEGSTGSYRVEAFLSGMPRYTGFCLDRMTNQDGETRLRVEKAIWDSEHQIEFFADDECQELLGQHSFTPEKLPWTTDPYYPRPTPTPVPTGDLPEPRPSAESPVVKLDPGQDPFPLPLAVFENLPDDVALIFQEGSTCYEGCPIGVTVYRVYRDDGELVREELFTRSSPPFATLEPAPSGMWSGDRWVPDPDPDPNSEQIDVLAVPDGSRIAMTLCQRVECFVNGMAGTGSYDPEPPFPETDLYESTDGGVTWNHIDTLERPWNLIAISRSQLLLGGYNNAVPTWYGNMLWPSMELEVSISLLGHPTSESIRERIEDVEGSGREEALRLAGILPIRLEGYGGAKYKPTIYPIAIQRGPFLRVVDDVDGCLPIKADPSLKADELACAAERVLLIDLKETVEVEGTTWHSVRTPAGLEGWAEGRHLE